MKILIDACLSPDWVPFLETAGHNPLHWSSVGSPKDKDPMIFRWAKERGFAIMTGDLDFSDLLAANQSDSPSVI